jgi:hypothetical protein
MELYNHCRKKAATIYCIVAVNLEKNIATQFSAHLSLADLDCNVLLQRFSKLKAKFAKVNKNFSRVSAPARRPGPAAPAPW